MSFELAVLLFFWIAPVTTIPMTIYQNAWFDPTSVTNNLMHLDSMTTMNDCACQCYNNSLCVTGTYFGINQTCILSSAHLSQGQLRLIINQFTNVFSFSDRITTFDVIGPPAIMEWSFDRNFDEKYGVHGSFFSGDANISENSDILWASPGYTGWGSAVHFLPNTYYVVDQYYSLTETNFTVSAWIAITFNWTSPMFHYFSLFSQCWEGNNDKCLHLVVGYGFIRLGFFGDDLSGAVALNLNQWYHVAYVYDRSALKQLVYLNGYLKGNRTAKGPYAGNGSRIIIGPVPFRPPWNFYSGYIDELIFASRVKNDTELLDEATLVAYYPFNGSYLDAGPNSINNSSYVATSFDSTGGLRQTLLFDSHTTSYFQSSWFYYLGQTNYSYSFSLWIYPFSNNGTILQVSSSNGWCIPMIGFNASGYLTIQTLGSEGLYAVSFTSALPMNEWSYVSMTYSITNGIRLFVNGGLIDSNNTYTDYLASGEMCTITIGNCLRLDTCAANGNQIVPVQYRGKIAELKIFTRELTKDDVLQLMNSSLKF